MIDHWLTILTTALTQFGWLALAASLGWGILSILLSPCHLTSIPLVIGVLSLDSRRSVGRSFGISTVFASGILLSVLVIGLITGLLGHMLGDIGAVGNGLVAVILILVGLYLMDILALPQFGFQPRQRSRRLLRTGFLFGLLFGIGVGPCTFAYMAPVLGGVFTLAKTSWLKPAALLLSFGLGHIAVIILAGTFSTWVQRYLNWTESSSAVKILRRSSGLLVIGGGIYLLMQAFGYR
ncbi:MAG: cytochrome C biogenesis protein [Candidatus Neomarinimicrobiota bacterium]|nr:MAG: cytochrome C biogenesis protein [Candidatus Neomarinimicrobiota bacterium]